MALCPMTAIIQNKYFNTNTYPLSGRIGPTLGPEPLDPGIKVFSFHNLGEGLHGYHNHAFRFHIYIHIIYIKFITSDITCMRCVSFKTSQMQHCD